MSPGYTEGHLKMRSFLVGAAALLALPFSAEAAVLTVGSGKQYGSIQAASNAANPGDVIEISAGVYSRGATFYDPGLIIRAAPGAAPGSVVVRGGTVQGKALFVTGGDNITIDGIRFENAAVPDLNGAGIRAEGRNLTVLNSTFFNNENGILASGSSEDNTLTVRGSRFEDTRSPAGDTVLTHAIYVGQSISRLVVEDSEFTRTSTGHHIKSRAMSTVVRGSLLDDADGTTSYLIETPEGGELVVEGNVLIQGPNAGNPIAIAHGFETHQGGDFVNPPSFIFIGDNEFRNKRLGRAYFFVNRTPQEAELHENELIAEAGTIVPAEGPHFFTTDADIPEPIDGVGTTGNGTPPSRKAGYIDPGTGEPPLQPLKVPAPPAALLLGLPLGGLALLRFLLLR